MTEPLEREIVKVLNLINDAPAVMCEWLPPPCEGVVCGPGGRLEGVPPVRKRWHTPMSLRDVITPERNCRR